MGTSTMGGRRLGEQDCTRSGRATAHLGFGNRKDGGWCLPLWQSGREWGEHGVMGGQQTELLSQLVTTTGGCPRGTGKSQGERYRTGRQVPTCLCGVFASVYAVCRNVHARARLGTAKVGSSVRATPRFRLASEEVWEQASIQPGKATVREV